MARTQSEPAAAATDVYTMAEAARLKGVSYHTASRAVRNGKLPARRVGRMAFISATDLAAWRPMVERAPKKYRRREPDPGAAPALLDLASGDRVALAQRFAVLVELVHAEAMGKPLPDFLELLCDRLANALGLPRLAIWAADADRGMARRLARCGGLLSDLPDEVPFPDVQAVGEFLDSGEATVLDLRAYPERPAPLADLAMIFVAPLRIEGRTMGVVVGDRGAAPFALDADQLAFSQAVANQAAIALEVARLRDRLAACEDAA